MENTAICKTEHKKRILYYDVMRFLAILFVIYNHTGINGFFRFSLYPFSSVRYWLMLFISIFCKFAVPLFFAVSGALMLDREDEPIGTLWRKRILKYLFILMFFSAVYAVKDYVQNGIWYGWKNYLFTLYSSSDLGYHLWYLYAYIAYLIGLPFLRSMVKNLSDRNFIYLMVLAVGFRLLPILECFFWNGEYSLNYDMVPAWLLTDTVLYPAIGYFLEHRSAAKTLESKLPYLWGINLFFIFLSAVATTVQARQTGVLAEDLSESYFGNFDCLNCLTVYLTLKVGMRKVQTSEKLAQFISTVGKCSFGVYLLHVLVMELPIFSDIWDGIQVSCIPGVIGIWVYILSVFVVSTALTFILRKIPLVKILVGG